jgi:hypothetical protein
MLMQSKKIALAVQARCARPKSRQAILSNRLPDYALT